MASPPPGGRTGGVGIGLRQPHYRHFAPRLAGATGPGADLSGPLWRSAGGSGAGEPHAPDPGLGFVEVHAENFFAEGGAALAVLQGVRERLDVSLHGVGLALGSAAGIDEAHLERLARLVRRIEPVRVSDHACFARVLRPASAGQPGPGELVHGADLLPIAFTAAQLHVLCANVQRVQDRLQRPLLIENLSAYLSFEDDDAWPEAEFLAELARRTGCGLLLDLSNLVVNALNEPRRQTAGARGESRGGPHEHSGPDAADPVASACAFVDALPPAAVGEIHLAGYRHSGPLVIDDHGSRVPPPVWAVYRHALRRLGAVPTLVEWDTDLPPIEVLLGEAAHAARLQREAAGHPPFEPAPRQPAAGRHTSPSPAGQVDADTEVDARRQRALLEALRPGAEPAPAARLRERGERLRLGLGAYRAHAAATAARALQAAYPTVAAWIGDEGFAALARALWQASPPRGGDLAQWGLDLPEFIETRGDLAPWPFLGDCARLDAAVVRCESAADAPFEPATLLLLATHEPTRLRLLLMPCVQLLASRWPIATLQAAHCKPADRPNGMGDDTALTPVRDALAAGRAEAVVVARDGWRAVVQTLEAPGFAWMQSLSQGLPLAAALVQAGPRFVFEPWLERALGAGWLRRAEASAEPGACESP